MDSFFKAAVCDLDKLLDDFELNTGKIQSRLYILYLEIMIKLFTDFSINNVILLNAKPREKAQFDMNCPIS